MKMVLFLSLVVFALFLAGCENADVGDQAGQPPVSDGQDDAPAAPEDPDPPKNMMDFVARNPLIFTDKDLEFLEFRLWDTEQSVIDALGEPIGREDTYEDQFVWPVYYLEFEGFGFVRMEPLRESESGDAEDVEYIVGSATMITSRHAGPRGIKVGDSYLDAVDKFYVDEYMTGEIIDDTMYLYKFPEGTMYISGRFIFDEEATEFTEEAIKYILYNFTPLGENDEFLGVGYTLAFTIEDGNIASIGMKKMYTNIVYE